MTEQRDLALPTGYTELLGELKNRVRSARTAALRTVNTQLIELYWSIGKTILERQAIDGWGSGVISRLAQDLRAAGRGGRGRRGGSVAVFPDRQGHRGGCRAIPSPGSALAARRPEGCSSKWRKDSAMAISPASPHG